MASPVSDTSLCRHNSKLETFLKRTAQRDVYERIRYYEACVVVSEELDKVFMHVVLTDDSIYLSEFHPRTLHRTLHFSVIVHIELINDLPDFLSGKDQEQSLHIRVVHTHAKDVGKDCSRNKGSALTKPQSVATPSQQDNYGHSCSLEGISRVQQDADGRRSPSWNRDGRGGCKGKRKSKSSVLPRMTKGAAGEKEKKIEEEEKKELHLYAVMLTSQIYVQLQRSWNSYIMRSTLMLRTCTVSSSTSSKKRQHKISWERTCHLFSQLSGELLQDELSLESLYLLLQELCTSAHHNPAVKTLFWRSPELYPFLVKTLANSLQLSQDRLHTADRLLLSMLVVQTMSLMFGETEKGPAKILTSKQGSVTAALLLALVCDPELKSHNCNSPSHTDLHVLQAEYLDAASVLLFEVVMFCQKTSRIPKVGHFLTVAWVFQTLKAHPFFSESPLSPFQAVLLYQRCYLLLTCMQHNTCVNSYIITELKEEFRYYVRKSGLEDKLPSHYPISRPAQHLFSQLLSMVLDKP
ncbi:hypothetical protein AMELA_G00177750 [Ameiurus melas]|uniref:Uncharacterized protein n=1 Tax=Ameiurus melas TaxID=219545 RepID=A0A7J6A9N3_AMEME|nr:hypothetical protein AMELA_G00177750 [Ameiurus melas]